MRNCRRSGANSRISTLRDPPRSEILRSTDRAGLVTIEVEEEHALETTRALIRKGFAVGPSSGLNYGAALEIAKELDPASNVI